MNGLVDYVTRRHLARTPLEELRQQYEKVLVDTLGYPKEELAIDFPLPLNQGHQTNIAPLVLFRSPEQVAGNAYMVVELAEPGSLFSGEIGEHVTNSGAEFFIWFDGYVDNPYVGPVSRGPYYFRRPSPLAPFERYPSLPKRGEAPGTLIKLTKRGRRMGTCPECGGTLKLYCRVACNPNCRNRSCYWFSLLYCDGCQRPFHREVKSSRRRARLKA